MNRTALTIVAAIVLGGAGPAAGEGPTAQEIYAARCAFCHGADGQGDGPAGTSLRPPPTRFSDPAYWKSANVEAVRNAIANGKPQTAMTPFGTVLSAAEIDALVAYLQAFARR